MSPEGRLLDIRASGLDAEQAMFAATNGVNTHKGALFLLDLAVPDFIPFADEILLGLGTLLLSRWKKKPDAPPPIAGRANRR